MTRATFITVLIATRLISIQLALAAGWPTTGGNSQHNGQASVVGPSAPQILWSRTDLATHGSQVYVEGDRMVALRNRGPGNDAPLVCYDLLTGEELWSVDFSDDGSSMPIGFRDGRVYAVDLRFSGHDDVYALNPVDGSILWAAPGISFFGLGAGLTFTTDGDLLLPGADSLARLDQANGLILWQAAWSLTSANTPRLGVFQDTVYSLERAGITGGVALVARDAATGSRLYASAPIPPLPGQILPMFLGPDGAIYVLRSASDPALNPTIHALEDTGTELIERWHAPIAVNPDFGGQYAIGIDGSLILVSEDGRSLVRRDPWTGAVLSTSDPLSGTVTIGPALTVDPTGLVYAALGRGHAEGDRLYAMDSNLAILWSTPFPGAAFSAPALAESGLLAMSGRSSVTVFATDRDLFRNGFESGDSAAWITVPDAPVPGQNAVTVAEKAALGGSHYGLVVKIVDSASNAYVESADPDGERTFTARFWLDPSKLDIPLVAGQNNVSILRARMNGCCQHVNLFISRSLRTGDYRLNAWVREGSGGFLHFGAGILLTSGTDPGPSKVQLEWRAATGPDAEDGLIGLTNLSTAESDHRRNLDNHAFVIDSVLIGTFTTANGGATGSYFFDEYESFR